MKNAPIVAPAPAYGEFTAHRLARLVDDAERMAELVRLAEVGARAEGVHKLQLNGPKPRRGRKSDRDFVEAIRDEARDRGVPLVDVLRRNAAVALLESKGHVEPTEHNIESVVAQLKRDGGTPEIQRLRKEVRSSGRRLAEK